MPSRVAVVLWRLSHASADCTYSSRDCVASFTRIRPPRLDGHSATLTWSIARSMQNRRRLLPRDESIDDDAQQRTQPSGGPRYAGARRGADSPAPVIAGAGGGMQAAEAPVAIPLGGGRLIVDRVGDRTVFTTTSVPP